METRASYVIVGAFTLLVVIGAVVAVIWMAGVKLDTTFARYDIFFEGSVTGLKPGAQVRYRGIPVGVVTSMSINPDNVEQVKVTIEVPQDTPIKEDAVASLEFQGITGVAYVQISGGTQEAPPLKRRPGQKRPVIPSKPSQLQELFETAPELINRFIALVDRANLLLNPRNQATFARTLGNIETFTGALAESSGDVRALLAHGAETLAELRGTASEARRTLIELRGSTDLLTANAQAALTDLRGLIGEMRSKIERLSDRADALMGTVQGNVDRVAEDAGTMMRGIRGDIGRVSDEASLTMAEVRAFTEELRDRTTEFTAGVGRTMQRIDSELAGLGGDVRAAIRSVDAAARDVGRAADELAGFIAENREPVETFTASGLYELTQLLSETRILVNALTRISAQIEQDPARFLFGRVHRGVEVK